MTSVELSLEASKSLVDDKTLQLMTNIFGEAQLPPQPVMDLFAQRLTEQTYEFLARAYPGEDAEEALMEAMTRLCPNTNSHCLRVAELAARFARELDLLPEDDSDDLEQIAMQKEVGVLGLALGALSLEERQMLADTVAAGGELHDIGKLAIPSDILNKPGRLTDAEFEVVRLHPLIGEAMLAPLQVDELVLASVRGHHERWDGGGYPDRLPNHDIPLEARIICIVDAFDAMTGERPYRQRVSYYDAAREILEQAGRQFDPELARMFAGMIMGEAA